VTEREGVMVQEEEAHSASGVRPREVAAVSRGTDQCEPGRSKGQDETGQVEEGQDRLGTLGPVAGLVRSDVSPTGVSQSGVSRDRVE
jgi:hypothetical protein